MRPSDQLPSPLPPADEPAGHLPLAVLRQYVAGTLPAAEQYRVERHTLACARCADVLEGLTQTDLATTDRAVADLQSRLQARVAQAARDNAPVPAAWPLRQMAAAVLLFCVAAALWLGIRRSTEWPAAMPAVAVLKPATPKKAISGASETIATPTAPPATAPPDNAVAVVPSVPSPQRAIVRRSPARRVLAGRVSAAPPTDEALRAADAVSGVAAASVVASPDSGQLAFHEAPTLTQQEKAETVPAAGKARARMSAAMASKKTLESQISAAPAAVGFRTVQGRITDKSTGEGLSGVTVLAKGTAIGVSTAPDGSFSLTVPESVTGLTISYIGYVSTERILGPSDSTLALALAPDTKALSEVVVVRREPPPAPISIGALPTGGYRAFRQYLADSLDYPEKALKSELQGTVKLSFVVAVDGSLQDIKVIKKLSEECDAEAVRLLKEGPSWHAAIVNGRRAARTVQVSVPFRLK